jgi:hypothetical protein
VPDGDITAISIASRGDAGINVISICKIARGTEKSVCGDVNGTAIAVADALGVDAVYLNVPS